jgi:hypothetical protein
MSMQIIGSSRPLMLAVAAAVTAVSAFAVVAPANATSAGPRAAHPQSCRFDHDLTQQGLQIVAHAENPCGGQPGHPLPPLTLSRNGIPIQTVSGSYVALDILYNCTSTTPATFSTNYGDSLNATCS